MNKSSIIFVFILAVTILVGCGQKTQEESMPATESVVGEETVRETVSPSTPSREQPQTIAQEVAVSTASSQESASTVSSEVFVKPTNEEIQKALVNVGLYNGAIDGVIGQKTKKAIEDFQSQNSLKVDGKVGPQTWGKLKTYLSGSPKNSISD